MHCDYRAAQPGMVYFAVHSTFIVAVINPAGYLHFLREQFVIIGQNPNIQFRVFIGILISFDNLSLNYRP